MNFKEIIYKECFKFCFIALISLIINSTCILLLYEILSLDFYISISISQIITQFFQYPVNKKFVFNYDENSIKYQSFPIIGSYSSYLLINLIITFIGTKFFQISWFFSLIIGIIIGFLFVFIFLDSYLFKTGNNFEDFLFKGKEGLQREFLIISLLFLSSLYLALNAYINNPIILSDGILCYLRGHNIIAHSGIPYFNWWHTPFYKYFIAFIIIMFNDNPSFILLCQMIIHALCVVLAYMTMRLKKKHEIALLCAIIYMTSFIGLYSLTFIHEEGLLVLFILFSFYFYFKYEEERKQIWLLIGTFFVGVAFFTKEMSIIILGIYIIYLLFWIKPPRKDIILSGLILLVFIGTFLIIQYFQDWKIINTYLGIGSVGGQDTFLSREGIFEYEKTLAIFSVDIILFLFNFIYITILIIRFLKKRKVMTEQVFSFSILFFIGLTLISRNSLLHFAFILFEMSYIGSLGVFWVISLFKNKSISLFKIFEKKTIKNSISIIILIFCIHSVYYLPNSYFLKKTLNDRVSIYQEISSIVNSEPVYASGCDALGYYIDDYYSDDSWYNSYKRNSFYEWNENEVFKLTSMEKINEFGIKYFVFSQSNIENDYFQNIISNGTLTSVTNYTYNREYNWLKEPDYQIIELYILNS